MHFSVITIFPDLITNYTDESILGKAQEDDLIDVGVYNPRDYTQDSHNSVDGPPYGGGAGMVMQAEPVLRAVEAAQQNSKFEIRNSKIFLMSAQGKQFDTKMAEGIEESIDHAIIICGRYEGIDQRVIEALDPSLISVGPYILTGGELPALIMVDSISRLVDGVLGNQDSLETSSADSAPVYTRPQEITHDGQTYDVPEILLSGHHEKIKQWRKENKRG